VTVARCFSLAGRTRVLRAAMGIVACAAVAAGIQGCSDSPTSPSMSAPFSRTDLTVGTGAEAAFGSGITVNYTGWLYDPSKTDQKGLQFDTSAGREAFAFTLGAGQVIEGWDEGLVGMKAGGSRRLIIPSALAYGASRNGPIPPFATLVFDIELLAVQ
jgi:FKBP-type peptidyl-prolyl cis-trans isomerase FkpA